MRYNIIVKREVKVMIVIVLLLVVAISGMSYAFFMRVNENTNNQVVTTGTLEITYQSTNGYINGGTYTDLLPLSDTDALGEDGYTFSVKNTGNLKTAYQVYLYIDQAGYQTDVNNGTITGSLFDDLSKIKYNLRINSDTNSDVKIISKQANKTENGITKYIIYHNELNANAIDNNVLRVWLDENLAETEIGKYVYLKLEVTSYVAGQEKYPKILCKRADVATLHTEICNQNENYCAASGYANGATITYGNTTTTSGTLASGDAFDCDVNGDGTYNPETERFYYVTDLNANTAVLIYYNDYVTSPVPWAAKEDTGLSSDYLNEKGPVTAIKSLPTINDWPNMRLTSTIRDIKDEKGAVKKSGFDYGNRAARLITAQEINSACGATVGSFTNGVLDSCNYLMENTKYAESSNPAYGAWTENVRSSSSSDVWAISGDGRFVNLSPATSGGRGIRPVIEVSKTDIDY